MKSFHTHILTPDGAKFEGETSSLHVPGSEGEFQVLMNHADLMSSLDVGVAKIRTEDQKEQQYAISGGFVEVKQNKITILAETAESPEEIDVDRALDSKKRAEERLRDSKMDQSRAHASLNRALNRLQLASSAQ